MALVLAAKDSSDTWAAIAHVIRNMLLNWLVFAPLLASVLLIPRILRVDPALVEILNRQRRKHSRRAVAFVHFLAAAGIHTLGWTALALSSSCLVSATPW